MSAPLRIRRLDVLGFVLLGAASFAALAAFAGIDNAQVPERDDPAIQYDARPSHDPIAELNRRLSSGQATLRFDTRAGYLRSVLDALNVPVESQLALFSKTGLQSSITNPRNPRSLFFNDNVVIGWVRGGVVEAAAEDPRQGVFFYTLAQTPGGKPQFMPGAGCVACHDSNDALGVPGMIVRSQFTGHDGSAMPQLGSFLVDHRTALDHRWGGWYVTGSSGGARHLGNSMVSDPAKPESGVSPATLNLASLQDKFDVSGYLSPYSDIAALMVFEHQMHVINLLTRLGWQARYGSGNSSSPSPVGLRESSLELRPSTPDLRESAGAVADYLLFVDEAPLTHRIQGSSGFAEKFSAEGPVDPKGRGLRQLDLEHRLMRYPCSYMIYSAAFDALPPDARDAVYRRMWVILSGQERSARYRRLPLADRQAVVEILRVTKKSLPAYFVPVTR